VHLSPFCRKTRHRWPDPGAVDGLGLKVSHD
jgi:hypothetical protein